ncbi:hypothetical protein ATL41_1271 [Flavimobilis soli]|uniref:Uncharacterized protein n=1 Tax=Flavimobilis soli TaxID=442709 RepID=A0A2A9ECB3_9MICO|nr:hypothetical protein ATL41_1271 [Flavimobilis soli]
MQMSAKTLTICWWAAMVTCGAMVVATFLTVGSPANGYFTAGALISMLISVFFSGRPRGQRGPTRNKGSD